MTSCTKGTFKWFYYSRKGVNLYMNQQHYTLGIDIGSTTVKIAVLNESRSLRPEASVWIREAIWSIKEPVPPAQIPFIRCSTFPPSK